jgi:hypothetical protein
MKYILDPGPLHDCIIIHHFVQARDALAAAKVKSTWATLYRTYDDVLERFDDHKWFRVEEVAIKVSEPPNPSTASRAFRCASRRWRSVEMLAREYRDLVRDGRVDRAGEVRRTIDDCGAVAGRYVDGRWTLHRWVRREMGVQS